MLERAWCYAVKWNIHSFSAGYISTKILWVLLLYYPHLPFFVCLALVLFAYRYRTRQRIDTVLVTIISGIVYRELDLYK
jgi:hypothetical protein